MARLEHHRAPRTAWAAPLAAALVACADPIDPSTDATTSAGSEAVDGGPAVTTDAADTTATSEPAPANGRVLMVVAYNNTWWPEYKVMHEALVAAGYEVEVRSSTAGAAARSYGDHVDAPTPGLPGVDPIPHDAFRDRFAERFGVAWDPAWNEPGPIPLDGRVQDAQMDDYVALVLPGGSGSQFLRYDGTYEDLPGPAEDPGHVSPAADMATAAAAINDLVITAFVQGSPVLAVCHAAPNPAFARVPGTEGEGPDGLGRSVLQGRRATGFPLEIEIFGAVGDVAVQYAALGIEFVPEQDVVVDGPAVDLDGDGSPDGTELLVTGRSWYPEEVVQAVAALLERLDG